MESRRFSSKNSARRCEVASKSPPWSTKKNILLLLFALISNQNFKIVSCESKEFDWSEIGIGRPSASSNLRILVSPQRRMTKGYDFDYSNSSQPISSVGETTYVVPSSNGQYVSTGVAPSSGHSAAYTALSASLASLKNRLSSRGVQIGDPNSSGAYGTSLTLTNDPQSQAQPQTSYLSVPSSQDHSSSVGASSSSENKTIVLAIPAKINFLSENRSSYGYKPQQTNFAGQQLTLIQPAGEQYYTSTKQVDEQASSLTSGQASGQNPDSQQYMIVNSQVATNGQSGPLMTTSLSGAAMPQGTTIYQSAGQAVAPAYQTGAVAPYGVKYVPITYPSQPQALSQSGYVEPTSSEQGGSARYISCPDSCSTSDPRWRKYSAARFRACCSRYSQYESQYDMPSAAKVSETAQKYAEDSQYQYLNRRSRSRRSRRPKMSRYNRYTSSSSDDETSSGEVGSSNLARQNPSSRPYYASHESPYMRYYRNRQQVSDAMERPESYNTASPSHAKYSAAKETRSYRRQRSREHESTDSGSSQQDDGAEDDNSYTDPRVSVAMSGSYSSPPVEETDDARGLGYDENPDSESNSKAVDSPDYSAESVSDGSLAEESGDLESRYAAGGRRKKLGKGRNGSRKGKEPKHYKRGRKSKYSKSDSARMNATDYESTQPGDQYPIGEAAVISNGSEEDSTSSLKDIAGGDSLSDSSDKESSVSGNKYKAALNESTVASLSKTTMHLKEILSILEKKAQLKSNESQASGQQTTTSAPITTTSLNPLSLLDSYGSSSLTGALTSEFLNSDLTLKSPYRLDSSTLPSSLSSPSLSSLSSSLSSFSSDSYSPLGQYSNKYSMGSSKTLPVSNVHHPRKRRPNKNVRYNNLMYPHMPSAHLSSSSLLHHGKHPFLKSSLYSQLQYPYWYTRSASPSVTSFYPYKNVNKTPYTPLIYTLG